MIIKINIFNSNNNTNKNNCNTNNKMKIFNNIMSSLILNNNKNNNNNFREIKTINNSRIKKRMKTMIHKHRISGQNKIIKVKNSYFYLYV